MSLDPVSSVQIRHIHPRAGYQRRIRTDFIMMGLTAVTTVLALAPLFWIIGYVLMKGSQSLSLAFFTQLPRPMGMEGGGVLHAIQGTLILSVLAGLFSIPPGLLAGFYVAYNPNTPLGTAVRFGTDVLSGVPSIVIGIVAYALVVKPQGHYSALAGGVSLSILMLPIIIRTTEEMLKLAPHSMREGSLALGAPEWKTAFKVTFPAALNGIVTGFLLALARASGETAPLLFTALGNERFDMLRSFQAGMSAGQPLPVVILNILEQPVDSLPLTLFNFSQQPFAERIDQSWGVALILVGLVLVVNLIARAWMHLNSRGSRMDG